MFDPTKTPRLYCVLPLETGANIALDGGQHHYLKNVLKCSDADILRLFHPMCGEFLGQILTIDKKSVMVSVLQKIRPPITRTRTLSLLFTPLKKERMDMVIEKAVELDVTDLYPITTQNCDVRQINEDRIGAQIIEAAEQCERLDIPTLHPVMALSKRLEAWDKTIPVFACLERINTTVLKGQGQKNAALLIGPAGGFTEEEKEKLGNISFIKPVSLGENILRSETAAIAGLSLLSIE